MGNICGHHQEAQQNLGGCVGVSRRDGMVEGIVSL